LQNGIGGGGANLLVGLDDDRLRTDDRAGATFKARFKPGLRDAALRPGSCVVVLVNKLIEGGLDGFIARLQAGNLIFGLLF